MNGSKVFDSQSPEDTLTLCVDCGGGGIKASVVDPAGQLIAPPLRTPTPYPLPPELLVQTIASLADALPPANRVSVGMPGMIRRGVVVATPHYITKTGPRSRVIPELVEQWHRFDMARVLEQRLKLPTLVWNDAEVAGAGVITGIGLEMIVTLGTGVGNAIFFGGRLSPHQELSQAPVKWGLTYDDYLGEHERLRMGDSHWSRRVLRMIEAQRPVFMWDRLYIGGGNGVRLSEFCRARLGDEVVIIPNDAGIRGGVRAWEFNS